MATFFTVKIKHQTEVFKFFWHTPKLLSRKYTQNIPLYPQRQQDKRAKFEGNASAMLHAA
ncbi:MAG: hypothetical protein LBK18_07725 [Prevotellaceae bacterium]|jgi:hypothetical protein|nr:hypothetical protein [Prevotellaceae bacterium]